MKKRFSQRQILFGALAFLALFAAGCVGGLPDASWGQVTTIGSPAKILLAFGDRVVMIDPLNGAAVNQNDSRTLTVILDEESQGEAEPEATAEPMAEAATQEVLPEPTVSANEQGVIPPWEVRSVDNTPLNFYVAPVVYDPDTLIVTAYQGQVSEVRLATGTRLSTRIVNGQVVDSPLIVGDRMYVPLSAGNLEAYGRRSTGSWERIWIFETNQGMWSQPLLVDDVLYVASLNHNLYALNAETGEELWSLDLEGAVPSTPVFHNGSLYIGSFARKIFEISLDGQITQEFVTNDWIWDSPAIVDGVLYAGDASGFVYALRIDDGAFAPLWEPRQAATRAIRATPLVVGDRIIVGSRDRFVYWLDANSGEEILKREVRGEVLADLVLLEPSDSLRIPEPLVLVSTMAHDQMLVAYTLNDGIARWSYGR